MQIDCSSKGSWEGNAYAPTGTLNDEYFERLAYGGSST